MPIFLQEIHDRCLAALDAEDSDRYTFDQDTYPSIQGAVETVVTWFNQAFADNKLTPESLRELTKVGVWQTNAFSRVSFDEAVVGVKLWSVLGIFPEIKTNKGVAASPTTNKAESKFRPELSFVESIKSAKRLTFEQWNQNSKNAFMPGNTILQGSLKEYAYLDFADYTSTSYVKPNDKFETTIRPDVSNKLIAIAYLKYPNVPKNIAGSIDFPTSLTDLITEITLNKISYKQGDQTNLYGVTAQNINRLISLIK